MIKKLLIFIVVLSLLTLGLSFLVKEHAQQARLAQSSGFASVSQKNIARAPQKTSTISEQEERTPKRSSSFRVGEKITYDVRLGNAYLGKAKFSHLADVSLEGKKVGLMVFETRLVKFKDTETIYSDIFSSLPVRIERDISTLLTSEKIIEEYDQKRFLLKIRKIKGKKEKQSLIRKNSVIHNAILLPFYVRTVPSLKIGWVLMAQLPNERFEIKLVAKEDILIPAGKFKAYRFVSNPKKFEIWISADKRRIPLKIKGMGNLGYVLVMKAYARQET